MVYKAGSPSGPLDLAPAFRLETFNTFDISGLDRLQMFFAVLLQEPEDSLPFSMDIIALARIDLLPAGTALVKDKIGY